MRIIAMSNQKGGVGKTTISFNLAHSLARSGKKILLIDFDPQGNATDYSGIDQDDERLKDKTIAQIFLDSKTNIENLIIKNVNGIDVIVANDYLEDVSDTFSALPNEDNKNFRLDMMLEPLRKKREYDFIIIDCRPSKGILVKNAIIASSEVFVPIQPEKFSVSGTVKMIRFIEKLNEGLQYFNKPVKKIDGAIISMCSFMGKNNNNVRTTEDIQNDLKELGIFCFNTIIHRNMAVSDSANFNKPVYEYNKSSAGSKDFEALAKEVLEREVK
jgi:chromosome partitioning protein